MSLSMRVMLLGSLSLSLLSFLGSGCATIEDSRTCSVDGVLSAGGTCTHTLTPEIEPLTFDQFLDFLQANPGTPNPEHPDDPEQNIGRKGAAICVSSIDFKKIKTSLETLCRMLKKRCSYELQQTIENMR